MRRRNILVVLALAIALAGAIAGPLQQILSAIPGAVAASPVTLDSGNKSADAALTNGNLTATDSDAGSVNYPNALSTTSKSSGLVYVEYTYNVFTAADSGISIGVSVQPPDLDSDYPGDYAGSIGVAPDGESFMDGAFLGTVSAAAVTAGQVQAMAVNFNTRKAWIRGPGGWVGNPVAGTGATFDGFSAQAAWFFDLALSNHLDQITVNFGASAFAYTIPTGFSSWDGSQVGP